MKQGQFFCKIRAFGVLQTRRLTACVALLSALVCLTGCWPPPQKAHLLQPSPTTNVSKLAKDYWENSKPGLLPPRARTAIEEFSVEYIDVTGSQPFERQPLFLPPPIDPIGLAITGSLAVSGIGRDSETYEAATMQRITGELYDEFERNLTMRGVVVLPVDAVSKSKAYSKLKTQSKASSSPLRYLQRSFSSDAGRVESSTTVPAPKLGVVVSDWGREGTDRAMLKELDAQLAVAVHLRIVIYHGAVGLMQGSTIRLVPAKGGAVELKCKRTIVSDGMVVEGGKWSPVGGKKTPVDASLLLHEVQQLFPLDLNLAFGSATSGSTMRETVDQIIR